MAGRVSGTITITVTGLNEAIRELEDIANTIKPKAKEMSQKLGDIATDEAQARYGSWNVTVTNRQWERGARNIVRATGNEDVLSHDGEVVGSNILFAEFGTGLLAGSHPWSTDVPNVFPGSYSETYGTGEYANTGMWHWGGMTFVYGQPTYAMYLGAKKSEDSVQQVIEEVFK